MIYAKIYFEDRMRYVKLTKMIESNRMKIEFEDGDELEHCACKLCTAIFSIDPLSKEEYLAGLIMDS